MDFQYSNKAAIMPADVSYQQLLKLHFHLIATQGPQSHWDHM